MVMSFAYSERRHQHSLAYECSGFPVRILLGGLPRGKTCVGCLGQCWWWGRLMENSWAKTDQTSGKPWKTKQLEVEARQIHTLWAVTSQIFIELDDGKNYRKALIILDGKNHGFPVDFPLNQSNEISPKRVENLQCFQDLFVKTSDYQNSHVVFLVCLVFFENWIFV